MSQPRIDVRIGDCRGTVGIVAWRNHCHAVLIEGNPEYRGLIEQRLAPTRQRLLFAGDGGAGRNFPVTSA